MRAILKGLSVILFLIGCLMITGAALWAWLLVVTGVAEAWGPIAGGIVVIATFASFRFWPQVVQAPWAFWFSLWRQADGKLLERLG